MSTPAQRGRFAAQVSRTLRELGLRPLPSGSSHDRQGVRVNRGPLDNSCTISVDLNSDRKRAQVSEEILDALNGAGYTAEATAHDGLLRVTR